MPSNRFSPTPVKIGIHDSSTVTIDCVVSLGIRMRRSGLDFVHPDDVEKVREQLNLQSPDASPNGACNARVLDLKTGTVKKDGHSTGARLGKSLSPKRRTCNTALLKHFYSSHLFCLFCSEFETFIHLSLTRGYEQCSRSYPSESVYQSHCPTSSSSNIVGPIDRWSSLWSCAHQWLHSKSEQSFVVASWHDQSSPSPHRIELQRSDGVHCDCTYSKLVFAERQRSDQWIE